MYCLIYYVFDDMTLDNDYKTFRYIIITMICVNILYMGLVVGKSTVFSIGADRSMFEKTESQDKLIYDTSSNL